MAGNEGTSYLVDWEPGPPLCVNGQRLMVPWWEESLMKVEGEAIWDCEWSAGETWPTFSFSVTPDAACSLFRRHFRDWYAR